MNLPSCTPAAKKKAFRSPSGVSLRQVLGTDAKSLSLIGKLRYQVWQKEGSLDESQFKNQSWIDPATDLSALHYVATDDATGEVVGSARLVVHATVKSADRDVELWLRTGNPLKFPVCDLGRLVVKTSHRRRGIAKGLNYVKPLFFFSFLSLTFLQSIFHSQVRIEAAKRLGARTVIATASESNASLLKLHGFVDIGETIVFKDRPLTTFYALQLSIAPSVSDNRENF